MVDMGLQSTTFSDLRTRLFEIRAEREEMRIRFGSLELESSAIETLLKQSDENSPKKKTRADHIRDALHAVGEGSPKTVAEKMTSRGWDWNGATPSAVVGVELNRLSSIEGSHVERVDRGIYKYEE